MSAVLVTGGAGFIGSALVASLLERGDSVRVLDNFSSGKRSNLAGFDGSVEIIEGDLRDSAILQDVVKGIEIIFHQAALVSVPISMMDPETCDEVNVHGTLNLLAAAGRAGVRRVVMASSAAVYGDSEAIPLKEDLPLTPLSPYAVSKSVNELYASLYNRVYNLEAVCLRYFNVYGPRQSPQSDYAAAIPIFLQKMLEGEAPTIYGDGGQARDFIFVEDVVKANILAGEAQEAPGRTYNICTGEEIRILDLIETLNRVLGSDIRPSFDPPRRGDIYRSLGDPSRASLELGFTPQVSLFAGLARTADWMRAG